MNRQTVSRIQVIWQVHCPRTLAVAAGKFRPVVLPNENPAARTGAGSGPQSAPPEGVGRAAAFRPVRA